MNKNFSHPEDLGKRLNRLEQAAALYNALLIKAKYWEDAAVTRREMYGKLYKENKKLAARMPALERALALIRDETEPVGLNFEQALIFHAMQLCADAALSATEPATPEETE